MRSDRVVRIGVVGLGNFGRLHAEVLASLAHVRLAAVCDSDTQRLHQVSGALGDVAAFDSFEVFVREADLDAVVLATPEDQHASQAIAAMERGWDVLVEKPLALTVRDALAVQDAARRTGRVAMVGTILRFSVPHRQLADAVLAGRLGRVLHVRSVRYISHEWFARIGVHPAFRATIHDIDLILWLTRQRVARVAAAGHTLPGEDYPRALISLLWMDGGTTAVVESHFILPTSYPGHTLPPERPGARVGRLEVIAEAGIARVDEGGGLSMWNLQGAYATDPFVVPRVGGHVAGAMRAELEHFLGCVNSEAPSTLAPLADSVHGVCVATAIVHAVESGSVTRLGDRVDEHDPKTPGPEMVLTSLDKFGGLTKDEMTVFLRQPWNGRLSTVTPEQTPYVVPVWYDYDPAEGVFYVVARERSAYVQHIRHNPMVAFHVADDVHPQHTRVLVEGTAEILEGPVVPEDSPRLRELVVQLSRRYMGESGPEYAKRTMRRPRYLIRIIPRRWQTWTGREWARRYRE